MGGNHGCWCVTHHMSPVGKIKLCPRNLGESSRDEEAEISLGLAAEPQSQDPPWVLFEQARTGSSCQSGDESLNHPNARLLLYPKPSPLPTAHRPPPAHQHPAKTCSPALNILARGHQRGSIPNTKHVPLNPRASTKAELSCLGHQKRLHPSRSVELRDCHL